MTKDGFRGQQSSRGSQRNRDFMKHYYDCTSRLFSDGRAGDHLNELFLNAAKNGDFERVQNFLARTSRNMTVNVDAKDKETGLTAIMLAAMNQHPKVVSLLLNYGADITLCDSKGQSILDLVSDSMRPQLLGSVSRQGFSARHLLQAAWQGNSQLVKKLLSSRFQLDVNCTNADGFTPLLLVTRDLNLFEKIEKAVMENGYNPVEVVKELLQNNADMEAKDSKGKRPLHFAAFGKGSHAKDVIDVLIQNSGGDIDVPDGLSDSPLHWASKEDNQPIILALIKGGADVNVRGHIGRTPLHVAASYGHERSSGTLLDHGADVTITDDNGLSPVDVAKGRRVQLVLTEAWAEQTKDSTVQSKRIFSAPPNHVVETESVQSNPEPESQDAVRSNTAPSHGLTRRLKKRSQSSLDDIYTIDERTKLPPSKKLSDVRMPRIPSAEKLKSTPGSLRSSLASVTKEQSGKQEFALGQKEKQPAVALPGVAVLNIELSYVSNIRGGSHLRAKMVSAQQPSPPRHRLSKRLSSPVLSFPRRLYTPGSDRDERLRSSSTSQVPDLSSVSRMAVPARVAPLGIRRVLTPELRSTTSLDSAQDNLSLVQDVVDLDLLRKGGHQSTTASSMLFPEVGEVTPPPPSPISASESPFRSEETGGLDPGPLETETAEGLDTTRTFTSIPRPTFWIPLAGDKDIENGKMPTPAKEDEASSNGTQFYIDLKHLEALSSGQCSACGKSLPEGNHPQESGRTGENPRTSQPPSMILPDKELCKSCQPRRGSNEEVFWIPFTEKEKPSGVKSKSEGDHRKTQDSVNVRRKSKDDIADKSKSQTANITEKADRFHSGKRDSNPRISSVVSSASIESTVSSRDQLRSEISPQGAVVSSSLDLTGFDVSCLCNNTSGVCSCTIVRKDLPFALPAPSEPASEFDPTTFLTENLSLSGGKEVVKTRGESSTPTKSTSVERRMDDFVSSSSDVGGSTSMVDTKSQTKKPSAATSTSLSEDNVLETTSSVQGDPKSANIPKGKAPQMLPFQRNQEVPSEVDQEGRGVREKHEPSPPKQAWTTPRGEEPGASSVTIVNAFPSPLPPEDRSAVHPPIGPAGDGRPTSKKGFAGKTKGKKAAGKSCCNGSKSAKSKNKAKSQGSSGTGKKKSKGKKKSDVKMITVQQREASEELGLRTISDGGGFDMPEDVPGPPTISLDTHSTFSRPFNTLMNKYMILSPIPESPRSVVSTPRTGGTTENTQEDGVQLQEQNTNVESRTQTEARVDLNDSTKEGNDGELDVVDGGMISRMFGMCIPRLNLGNSDSDSDTESNEPLVNQCDLASEQESVNDAAMPLGTGDDSSPDGGVESQDVVQDEADDEMEEIIQSQLETKERTNDSALQSNPGSNSWSHAVTQDSLTDVTICRDSGPSERSDESNESVISFKYSASGKADSELITPDEELDPSRATSAMTSFSDTDSSYNSCDSASPRPLSSASSLNSSDTYFSSPRDSSCAVTPTPDRETYSENSVEIEYFERMKSSVSSASGSTVRAQSNTSLTSAGAGSQGSADSFATENLVRSRLSATSRSISSSSSGCQDEIVWKKGNIVGRGAFGTVCCGLTNTGEIIAVKQVELNHSNSDEAEQYEKLQEEVSLLKSLTHENIVRFIGTCFDGGVVNIFMEYVPGGSIASILARFGCLDESVFCRYTKQLLSGVSYLHGNNVIHRDIKGGNILIMPSGVLKLIDFGCAKRLCLNLSMSKSNILRSMKGTPYWMAPEVIRETGHGRKSDIWSVGCTVYEMATRKPPWSDMPPMAAIFAIGSGSLAVPELSETVTKEARDFVNKCLTRDPDVRPSADELLQHPFIKHPS